MAGRKLDPRKTRTKEGVTTTTSWAAIAAAFFALLGFLASAVSLAPGTADMDLSLAVYVGACFGVSITLAILALGDDG